MIDFEARRIIEALRTGVPSRAVSQYFSSARQDMLSLLSKKLNDVCENNISSGMVITGKYGEGKTHLLNTVLNMAQKANMAVSIISLGKETPLDKLHLIYPKLLQSTYLPNRLLPGFLDALSNITPNSPIALEMTAYIATHMKSDKLYYLFRSYLYTDDPDEKHLLISDLEGDYIGNEVLKKIYKRVFSERCVFENTFSKTKHIDDYFAMISNLFLQLGCNGWVILFDETELTGKLGKKARLKAYMNMASFLFPDESLQSTFSLFAVTDSYVPEVIEDKHEYDNLLSANFELDDAEAVRRSLDAIESAIHLKPLTKDEISLIIEKLIDFYKRAYDWYPNINIPELYTSTDNRGHLLRTRIRAVVECLDQLYQYRMVGDIRIDELPQMRYEEDVPELYFDEEALL
jgi:hypothetical protein